MPFPESLLPFIAAVVVGLVLWIAFRVRLDAKPPILTTPEVDSLSALAEWLANREAAVPNIVEGAEARIQFANPDNPARTDYCFLYVHGFSATWPETAPVTEQLAARFDANVLQARLAGHGEGSAGMETPAEEWLASLWLHWDMATRLGRKVVVVATSTGAPLSVWLAAQPGVEDRLTALLFMSPNFRIRSPFGFLLTWPLSRYWMHLLVGREREWEPINEAQARFWTWRYSTRSLIEMQKVVDWVGRQDLGSFETPLAVMVMKNDPTIDPESADRAEQRWGGSPKALIPVEIDPDAADHVFAGDITAPHRVEWTVDRFTAFLESIPTERR